MEQREQPHGTSSSERSRAGDGPGDGDGSLSWSLGDLLLRTPLLHRILLGNALVVALGAVAGTAVAVHVGRAWTGTSTLALAAGFAGVGLGLSVVVNAILVRWLLDPLERLERAADRIQDGADPGDEEVVVPATTDPGLRRLVRVFNAMLRSLARQRTRLREMAVRGLETGEEERDRISSVLQEDTAQRVASCLVRLRWARSLDGSDRDRALDDLRSELSDVLGSIRGLARSLRAPELDDIGLESALRALAREVRQRWGPEVRLALADVDPLLDPDDRLILYRAVETTLRSWAPEAGSGGAVHVSLEWGHGVVLAEIADGPGPLSAVAAAEDDPGPALSALRERARFSGGDIDLMRGPKGSSRAVRIRLPVVDRARLPVPLAPGPGDPGVPSVLRPIHDNEKERADDRRNDEGLRHEAGG